MVTQTQYLTPEGFNEIEERLHYLREVRRMEVTARLRRAMGEGGDLKENAEYVDAKDEQAFVEGEIRRLEDILSNVRMIEPPDSNKQIQLGSLVTLAEEGSTDEEVYQLVGSVEANPSEGKISIKCPVGHSLLGAKAGDKITVDTPDGKVVFIIKAIH